MDISANKELKDQFSIVSSLGLIWFMLGAFAFFDHIYMSDKVKSSLSLTEQAFYANTPLWVNTVFGIAVMAGVLGCVALLWHKRIGIYLLIISLISILMKFFYLVLIQKIIEVTPEKIVWNVVIITVVSFLTWYAKEAKIKGFI